MRIKFCPQCGRPLILRSVGDEGLQSFCSECARFYFDYAMPCVLTAIVNEHGKVLLLRQKHIHEAPTLCSGYVKKGDTLEETVVREVPEETGQQVMSCQYAGSWYYPPKGLIMAGFLVRVIARDFARSAEVDGLFWADVPQAQRIIARENNLSGTVLDAVAAMLNDQS